VQAVRDVVRDYDVIVRYGGDEFICGMADVVTGDVAARFEQANQSLRNVYAATVSVGVVERQRGEGLGGLIQRADAAMYESRARR
jgi:diguanylate cyclase (GGDEF)-like protein